MADLPIDVEFAAAYLDGAMECESSEIQKQWSKIRKHLAGAAKAPEPERDPDIDVVRRYAIRAIAANRIVGTTNDADIANPDGPFERIHDLANDLTIDTQRDFARVIGWLVGSDDMAPGLSSVGVDLFDEITHGNASDEKIACAFREATGTDLDHHAGERSLLVRTDTGGFVTLHEPDEDGNPGDLVASVWRDDWLPELAKARDPERASRP